MLPWKLRKCQILPVSQNLSSVYFSLAKFQLVSCNPSLAMIWQMTYTHKLPKLCPATLISLNRVVAYHMHFLGFIKTSCSMLIVPAVYFAGFNLMGPAIYFCMLYVLF